MGKGRVLTLFIILLCVLLFISSFSVFAAADFTPPKILSKAPTTNVNVNPVTLRIETDESAICKYDVNDVAFSSMANYLSSTLSYVHTKDLMLSETSFLFYVRCSDAANNSMTFSEPLQFSFDAKPPLIINTSNYIETHSENYVLSVKTNEPATCRIASSNVSYPAMELFTYTGMENQSGLLLHNHLVTGLKQGYNTFYVKCSDLAANAMAIPFVISLNNLGYLTADITFEKKILTAGIHKITITTNVPLRENPSLSYSFDNLNFKDLIVNGRSNQWTAYLELPADTGVKEGNFRLKATDIYGYQTSYISSGASFSVDTVIPRKITTIITSRDEMGKIQLLWNKEDDDIKYYEIYKTLNTTITHLDKVDEVYQTKYMDVDVLPEQGYYYSIRAVDNAENKAAYSEIVFVDKMNLSFLGKFKSNATLSQQQATSSSSVATSSTTSSAASSDTAAEDTNSLLPKVVDEFKLVKENISTQINKIDEKKEQFQKQLPFDITENLGVFSALLSSRNSLKELRTQAETLDLATMNTVSLKIKIKELTEQITKLIQSIPEQITVVQEKKIENKASADQQYKLLLDLSNNYEIDDKVKESMRTSTEKVAVTTALKHVSVQYANGTTVQKLLVTKEFSLMQFDRIKTYHIIDKIPKEVIQDITNKLSQQTGEGIKILENDPVISYKIKFEQQKVSFTYLIDGISAIASENDFLTFFTEIPITKQKNAQVAMKDDNKNDDSTNSFAAFFTGFSIRQLDLTDKKITFFDTLIYIFILTVVIAVVVLGVARIRRTKARYTEKTEQLQSKEKNERQQHNKQKQKQNKIAGFFTDILIKTQNNETLAEREITNYQEAQQKLQQGTDENPFDTELFKVLECDSLLYANQLYEELGIKSLNNIHILSLLEDAHIAINNMQFEKANNIYHMLLNTHAKHLYKLNQSENIKFKNGLNKLCIKLNLYTNLWYAHVVVKKKDYTSVRNYLNKIAEDFNRLTKRQEFDEHNTKLLNYISNYHTKYAELLVNEKKQ